MTGLTVLRTFDAIVTARRDCQGCSSAHSSFVSRLLEGWRPCIVFLGSERSGSAEKCNAAVDHKLFARGRSYAPGAFEAWRCREDYEGLVKKHAGAMRVQASVADRDRLGAGTSEMRDGGLVEHL